MNRNRLPRWVNAVIDRIADAPMSPLGKLAARRLGQPAPTGSVGVTSFDPAPMKVLIAPVNYSGQGREWAQALENHGSDVSARNMAIEVPGGFSFSADLEVPVGTYHNDPDWQRRQLSAASAATHILIEAEEPPFGRLFGRSVAEQAAELERRGVSVAHMAHGTDVRLPSRHADGSRWSFYRDETAYLPRAEALAARNIALVEQSGRPAFVSTPDLLLDLPQAHWCPVVVREERWSVERPPRQPGHPLRVAHAPSNPVLKGTPLILPVLERLEDEGLIELRLVEGVPSARMPAVFAGTDVLLDQFRLGSYGVAACEAMAGGCVVVGQVSEQVRDVVRTVSGVELPIVEATPDTLERTLRNLAGLSPEEFARMSSASKDFVRAVHDGRLSAGALRKNWIDRDHWSEGGERA